MALWKLNVGPAEHYLNGLRVLAWHAGPGVEVTLMSKFALVKLDDRHLASKLFASHPNPMPIA